MITTTLNLRHLCRRAFAYSMNTKLKYEMRTFKNNEGPSIHQQVAENKDNKQTKQQVLKTYLEVIPPYRLQSILHPEKTDVTEFVSKGSLNQQQMQKLHKKIKKSVHMIPIQSLTQVLEVISNNQEQNQQSKMLSRKIYTKIVNIAHKKLNMLSLEQIIDFMYKLVKLNHKQFEFMKEVQRVIIEEKIKINYPLIRKILWSYTHLDVGSAVLYSHISKTLKVGQHEFSPLQLAEAAFMLSKSSQNTAGGFGLYKIAEKQLQLHLSRLDFHDLVKASSYMLAQNIGTNQFQTELQTEIYRKYPDRPHLRINDLVTLLKSTSTYFFKYKEKALLNMLQASTNKLAPQANLEQFEDIVWSWGRAGKGDRDMWAVLEAQINSKFINLLKPRQLAFFYYSLCCTEYSSAETVINLEKKFMEMVKSNPNINEHYLLKFLLGMQKRKDYSQNSFVTVSKLITDRLSSLSPKQLVAFAKIINESDLCYENKQNFKEMQASLMRVCKSAIAQRIYLFRLSQIVEIVYMWIKLDVAGQSSSNASTQFVQSLLNYLNKSLHQIPKSAFLKSLFCFTIKDKYKQSFELIAILQELTKYGPITYFFSPYELPLAAYCVFHLIVNSQQTIPINTEMVNELAWAMDKTNPAILNKFVRNGYEECMRLKKKYYSMHPQEKQSSHPNHKPRSRNKST